MRQTEAAELAKTNDLMIVVGSKNSANTTHLAEILTDIKPVIHIETSEELKNYKDLINKSQKIAITAGASTPQSVIDSVVKALKEEE
jgi:4-hydroxy-3-methylbut-2-enyl diphosphate reductase